jgi:hypothetical protein
MSFAYLGPFTPAESRLIALMARRGRTHDQIANRSGASLAAIQEFCDRNGLRLSEREALPAGSRITWDPILVGSSVTGTPFKTARKIRRE